MTRQTCAECGTRMIDVGFDTHMSCEPSIAAEFRHYDRMRREGQRRAEMGKRAALRSNPKASQIGLRIIRQAAQRLEHLSAHDVRDDLEAAGIDISKAAGGLWSAAIKAEIVTPTTEVPGSASANGKSIHRYKSLVYRQEAAA